MKYKVKANFICNGLNKKVDQELTSEDLEIIASNVQSLVDKECLEAIQADIEVNEKSDQPMSLEEYEETQKKKKPKKNQ